MYTLTFLLSTAPSMYSAHNKYQTHNLCPVSTLSTPTTQQYICRTCDLFNSSVHFSFLPKPKFQCTQLLKSRKKHRNKISGCQVPNKFLCLSNISCDVTECIGIAVILMQTYHISKNSISIVVLVVVPLLLVLVVMEVVV